MPFLSHETKVLMRERDALKEESTVQGCPILFNEYKVKRNKVKAMVQSDKINYYKSRLHDQSFDIKKVWKTVYNVLGNIDNKAPKQIRQGDRIINNPKLMAEALNKTFQDKVKKLRNQTNIQPVINPSERLQLWLNKRENPTPNFALKQITLKELREALSRMKYSRSHGIDFIDAYSIKLAGPLIEDSLLHIVNLSITSGVFPSTWKTQLVLPLHKKNDKLDGNNYRPVSHIVELGKIVEFVIHKQVYDHFDKHLLFHKNHHGFLSNHSTATALIQLQDLWLSACERKELSAALLLDLLAAFDIVDHNIFLEKLRVYGFSAETIEWFSSYLKERKQVVQVESCLSSPAELGEYGVPQGSVLGPLIFIIFNNDLPASSTESESILYADDDTVTVSAMHPGILQDKLQEEANISTQWITDNRMVCSGEKTKLLMLGTAQLKRSRLQESTISVSVCGKIVNASFSEKLLGLIVNDKMSWTDHLYGEHWRQSDNAKGMITQLSQRVGLLSKLVKLMPKSRFHMVCQGLFYSKLLYCIQIIGNVWGLGTADTESRRYSSFTKEDNRRLQTLQNKVMQLKTGLPPGTPTKTLLEASGDLSVQQLIAYVTLSTCQKMVLTGKPIVLAEKFKQSCVSTRQGINIRIEANLTLTRGAFFYRAAVLFNKLPQDIRDQLLSKAFREKMREWIRFNVPVKPA